MNKVIIDKIFFNLDSSLSEGLISGLSRLSQRNFIIEVKDYVPCDYLASILKSEKIILNSGCEDNIENIYTISQSREPQNRNNIFVSEKAKVNNFEKAAAELIKLLRSASVLRKTKETEIKIDLTLDGEGKSDIKTGIGFFDHMLEQISRHGNIDLNIKVKGDLNIDEHHTVEDTGIVLGTAIDKALGERKGIRRYGFFLPMDEAVAKCAVDLGGRSYLNFKCKFTREKVGDFPVELTEEFFRGLASGLKGNIILRAKGKNDHHKIEAMFKAFARALNEACRMDERNKDRLPSTKGII